MKPHKVKYTTRNVYLVSGKLHRDDGPAVEYSNGRKEWWIDGKRHREDGPAIMLSNGDEEWFINGRELSAQETEIIKFMREMGK